MKDICNHEEWIVQSDYITVVESEGNTFPAHDMRMCITCERIEEAHKDLEGTVYWIRTVKRWADISRHIMKKLLIEYKLDKLGV